MINHNVCFYCGNEMDVHWIHKVITYTNIQKPQQELIVTTQCYDCGNTETHKFFWRPGYISKDAVDAVYKHELN